ncbi:hypothetical protein E2C01_051373 [Portunus trituberculatus]|uniref:Uncharacterized protein n=1 Tax=Portunus trituberculatus TaxID=210409 RepID=A0A5B7GLM6_PORTR|nr:hypothetical protein [Portunus trituberculatus]
MAVVALCRAARPCAISYLPSLRLLSQCYASIPVLPRPLLTQWPRRRKK